MKALRFSEFGLPSVLRIEEIPRPERRDGEALVKVKAAAINPSDVKNVAGRFSGTTLPRTPGRDFSGVVIAGTKYETRKCGAAALVSASLVMVRRQNTSPSRRKRCR